MKSLLFTFLFLSFTSVVFSQTTINGTLKDTRGEAVRNANILLLESGTQNIISYAIADSDGYFSLSVNSREHQFDLKVNSLGYKSIIQTLDNETQTLDLVLEAEVSELKEVNIESSLINQRGDTLAYSVSAFSHQQDRTIGDVLKNMPGFDVLKNGKILYQGEPISKYYIENMDLLGGRYGLANKNLSYKEVEKVEVLENHQPVKILDSLSFSDKTAINLKLKKKYTFAGQIEAGAGFLPLLWDINITPMLFTPKRQMITSYQANNTGNNVADQLETLTLEEFLDRFERNDDKSDWMRIQKLQEPDFSEKRWLENNIHLLTANYLQQLKKDYEFRINTSYLNDYQQQNGHITTRFFTGTDTIALIEDQYNQLYPQSLKTELNLERNTSKSYFKNNLQFQGYWDHENGHIETLSRPLQQNLKNHYFKISNDLKTLFPIGAQIATLKSYIDLSETPQSLHIQPGPFEDALNSGKAYDKVFQDLHINTFYTHNSIGITKGWKNFSFNVKTGFQYEKQKLRSQIFVDDLEASSNSENHLDWNRFNGYFHLTTQYKKDRWRIELTTPVDLHHYKLTDQPSQKGQDLHRVNFDPQLTVNYDLAHFWKLRSSVLIDHQYGTINQIYYNYILRDYRNLQRTDAPLPEHHISSYSFSFRYRNPLNSLFFNFSYRHNSRDNNLLYDTRILASGALERKAVKQKNKRKNHTLSVRIGKYFSSLNTNLSFRTNLTFLHFQQILNTNISAIDNQSTQIQGKLNTDFTDWLNVELKSVFQSSHNTIQHHRNSNITRQFHTFEMNIYPKENQFLGLKTEFAKNRTFSSETKNFFADLIYRYTWEAKNIDFELNWNNIFNAKEYSTVSMNDFSYYESTYRLRPAQLLFKIRFSL